MVLNRSDVSLVAEVAWSLVSSCRKVRIIHEKYDLQYMLFCCDLNCLFNPTTKNNIFVAKKCENALSERLKLGFCPNQLEPLAPYCELEV